MGPKETSDVIGGMLDRPFAVVVFGAGVSQYGRSFSFQTEEAALDKVNRLLENGVSPDDFYLAKKIPVKRETKTITLVKLSTAA